MSLPDLLLCIFSLSYTSVKPDVAAFVSIFVSRLMALDADDHFQCRKIEVQSTRETRYARLANYLVSKSQEYFLI